MVESADPIHHPNDAADGELMAYKRLALTVATVFALAGANGLVRAEGDQNTSTVDRLLACDAITHPGDRLACFDSIAEGTRQDRSATILTTRPSEAPSASPDRPDVLNAPEAREVVDVVDDDGEDPAKPEAMQSRAASAGTADPVEPETRSPRQTAAAVDPNGGSDEDLTGRGVIVRVWQHHDGRFSVELDNGHVWRETEGTRVGTPKTGSGVAITRGRFGGFRMKIDGIRRQAWVRPTG